MPRFVLVEGEGFEPSKAEPSDLQSDPFDRSGTPPNETEHYGDFPYLCQTVGAIFCLPPGARATGVRIRYHGTVRAKKVVIATNGYTPQQLHPAVRATLLPVLSHIIVTRALTPDEIRAANFVTPHVLTDSRKLLYYWRRLPDDRILFGGRGLIADNPERNAQQREFLLSELKEKYPGLERVTVDYDWHGWVCLTRDFLPHIHHAEDDMSVHYALGYQGSGVSLSLFAGKLLAQSIAGHPVEQTLPALHSPLARYPLHRLVRIPQRLMYLWYRHLDNSD